MPTHRLPTFRSAIAALALLALAPLLAQTTPPPAGESQQPPANVVFLHWNDFHGQFRPQRAIWKLRPGLASSPTTCRAR